MSKHNSYKPDGNTDLAKIITSLQNGNNNAFEDIFNLFYNDVYNIAMRNVNDSDAAGDITQETFIEIFETISSLREPDAFRAWMKKIAYHRCTKYFRSKANRHEAAVSETEYEELVGNIEEDRAGFSPEESLDQHELRDILFNIIESLPAEQRAAVLMYYYEDMTVADIAEIQSVSAETVKSRLYYGRKALKKGIEEYEKKSAVTLHGLSVIPMFRWALDGQSFALPPASVSTIAEGVASRTGTVLKSSGNPPVAGQSFASKFITSIKAFVSANKVASIVVASAVGVAAVGTGVGIAVANTNEPGDYPGKNTEGVVEQQTTGAEAEGTETDVDSTMIDTEETTAETEKATETEKETEAETEKAEEKETKKEEATEAPETEVQTEDQPADSETKAPDNNDPEPTYVGVASVTLDRSTVSLTVGETVMPIVTMSPSNASNKSEIWTSNNTRVASVDQEGNITATGAGECVITINSTDNVQASASVKVTVTDPKAQETQPVETTSAEETPKVVQAADLKTGISWDGKSPIIFTYPDGTTGTEMKVGATYESLPGMIGTVREHNMPGYVAPKYDGKCSDCGKVEGDGTNGTCVRYSFISGDMPCPSCGETIPEDTCHTCK